MTDHDELRRLAEAAREVAPGEWRGTISDDGCGEQHEIVDGDGETVVGLIWYDGPQLMMGDEIKAHIVATQPATVLALLDERDRLREALKSMLFIFNRELPESSIGAKTCRDAQEVLLRGEG
jgi:HAMP domain-containing protein